MPTLSNYTGPTNATQAFYDFHCLQLLDGLTGISKDPVQFRAEEAVKEAFHKIKTFLKAKMLTQLPLACLEEALHVNLTQEYDLERVYACLVGQGQAVPGQPVGPSAFGALQSYCQQVTPRWGTDNAKMAALLTVMLGHSHFGASGSVVYAPIGVSSEALAAFVKTTFRGQVDLAFLRRVFALHWTRGVGGAFWHGLAQILIKLQASVDPDPALIALVYDAEKESGSLLAHAKDLFVPKKEFHNQSVVTSPKDYMPFVSPSCRHLLAVTHHA